MNSTLVRICLRTATALAALLVAWPAAAVNHDTTVNPIAPGRFAVACSNIEQDVSLIAPGLSATDYWEGRDHYIEEILAHPETAVRFPSVMPNDRTHYPGTAGAAVPYVAIICHPTPASNGDPGYVLPSTGDAIPHMQPAGAAPKLISAYEYAFTLGTALSPPPLGPAKLPLIVYSHGLGGSPISQGYVDVLVQLAAQGFMVAGIFHGDPRFSRVRVQDLGDFAYLLLNFDHVVEMELVRPASLKTMLDVVLASPYAAGVDSSRIGGFGASLGGEAMTLLAGAHVTTTLGAHCEDVAVHDPRIRAIVGYVPFAGYSFLPAFCQDQDGAAFVNRPYLAISGTADTTAPLPMMEEALNRFASSRYMVQWIDGLHELRPQDAGNLFTWMVTFYGAYLDLWQDPTAMARFIRMNTVVGGRDNSMIVDVHVPFADQGTEATAIEFYNAIINHYFVSADPAEIAAVRSGDAGNGWRETGLGFKAWMQMPADTLATVAPACRFRLPYTRFASSVFYTTSGAECDSVKASIGWRYTGIGFYIAPVGADGTCPSGYLAVQRAYNNGYLRNDSNHRFSTSDSEMRAMAREGWAAEGNVMCSRP